MTALKISKFQVSNFRNLYPDIIEFSSGINCILGKNGNGKTNLLEALYVLGNKKSFRKNASFPQYLNMDGDKCEIYFSAIFMDEETCQNITYSGKMKSNYTEWFLNGKFTKEKINAFLVFINPFDFYSFHFTPKFRRDWFDQHISLLSKIYKNALGKYNYSLKIRNNLLGKRGKAYLSQIKAVDEQIARYSYILTQERINFINEINDCYSKIFKKIFSHEYLLQIMLKTKFSQSSKDDILNYYQINLTKDAEAGLTLYGVHRDDYTLLFDGLNSLDYCSLGQQKMSYLSLLFAYVELFRYKFNTYPIVLIDDVSGELDHGRWHRLIEYLEERKFQVFITTANESFKEKLENIQNAKKIYINAGKITVKN